MARGVRKPALNFTSMPQKDVPQGRSGKHKAIVPRILSDLDRAPKGTALKVPLAQLAETTETARSARNRATRTRGLSVATASGATALGLSQQTAARPRTHSSTHRRPL